MIQRLHENRKMKIIGTMICLILPLVLGNSIYFETPSEYFLVTKEEISKDVLKNTIGIFTLNSGVKNGQTLTAYERKGETFHFVKTLNVKGDTQPVSYFGYSWESTSGGVSNYRYPLIEKNDKYLSIVIDPVRAEKVWINLNETKMNYSSAEIFMLDSLRVAKLPAFCALDIFHFDADGMREFYASPDQDSTLTILNAKNVKHSFNKILAQENGYLKIKSIYTNKNSPYEHELVGWIKMRDNLGQLSVWLEYADTH